PHRRGQGAGGALLPRPAHRPAARARRLGATAHLRRPPGAARDEPRHRRRGHGEARGVRRHPPRTRRFPEGSVMNRDLIEQFVADMRTRYAEQIEAVALPDGTTRYLKELMGADDHDTIEVLLKLSYLMGLQTGFAAAAAGAQAPEPEPGRGPLQA